MKSLTYLCIFVLTLILNLFFVEISSLSLERIKNKKISKWKRIKKLKKKLRKFRLKLHNQKELNDELKCEIKKCKFGKFKKFEDIDQVKHVHIHKTAPTPVPVPAPQQQNKTQ
jgi:flagellar biosynthesis protein FliP